MRFRNAYIPAGIAWSTPFVKWQGSFASAHPLMLAADAARRRLAERGVEPVSLTSLVLGLTIPSKHSFYGAPWVASRIGAPGITGPVIMQACATGARCLAAAASAVDAGGGEAVLIITADRTSNGPHLYYPDPAGPGGRGEAEDWVLDNFGFDPVPGNAMIATAENAAREAGITREEQEEVTLLRYTQYADALADDRAFLRRFMLLPFEVRDASGRRVVATVTGDEGIFPTTPEALRKLRPVLEGGTVTFGTQTHPADGNAGLIVATEDVAAGLSADRGVSIRLVSFAEANARKGHMPEAVVPAAEKALRMAGFTAGEVRVKTHNPFAVNDILLSRALGIEPAAMNRFGSSLVYGHPQAPTGTRGVIELVEELVMAGGGRGLFVGCAAGDTAAAITLEVRCR